MQKLFTETKKFFSNPTEAFTESIETASEWTSSRKWLRILPVLPIALGVIGVYVFAAVRESAGDQQQIRAYFEQMDSEYPLAKLETILYRDHLNLGGKPLDFDVEAVPGGEESDSSLASRKAPELVSSVEPPTKDQLKEFSLTIERLQQVVPDNNEVAYRSAVIKALEGNMEEANSIIDNLVGVSGIQLPAANHWEAVNLLNKRLAGENVSDAVLNRVLNNSVDWRNARPAIKIIYAEQNWRQQKYDRALELMMSASESVPDQLIEVARRAKANNRERLFQQAVTKAERYYRTRLDTALEKPSDRINFATTQLLLERKGTAIEILNSGIQNSSIAEPELKMALSNLYLGEFSELQKKSNDQIVPEAMVMLQKAIETEPMNPQIGLAAAMLISNDKLPADQLPKSLSDVLARQIAANKVAPDTLMVIGGMYYKQGKLIQAETAWRKVVELVPTAVSALNNLAVLEFEHDKPNVELAIERIQKAFELQSGNVEVCDSYGQVLYKAKRYKDAIAKFELALRLAPNRTETREMLAKCYEAIGQKSISEAQTRYISKQQEAAKAADNQTDAAAESSTKEPTQ